MVYFGKCKHGTGDLEFHLNLRKQKMLKNSREEVLSSSMNSSRGSRISSSGGVFKNSFSVHFPVTVVLIVILGYCKGLMKRRQPVVFSCLFVRT